MKKIITALLICIFILSACNNSAVQFDETQQNTTDETQINTTDETTEAPPEIDTKPTTDDEMFEYVISKWKQNSTSDLYDYANIELKLLLNKSNFAYMFESVSDIGGALNDVTDVHCNTANGIATYTASLDFDNIIAEISISFKNLKICAISRNIYFKNSFEIMHENGIVEKYFVLESDGCKLNAVYTYVNDKKPHPSALLIAGSGPSDYNETIGVLTPFEDISLALAKNGINSLRIDKRTLNYASELDIKLDIEQEYIIDYSNAIEFLKEQNISEIYLLGHSLGGQIAVELATKRDDIDGVILFNSSARHLADIACDQYAALDPRNKNSYILYAEAAKGATKDNARGYYYYSASDYYWASYNKLDTLNNLKNLNIKTLIINSKFDNQSFEADIEMWRNHFSDNENVSICIFDDISHLGYKINMSNPSSVYKRVEFPDEIINTFSNFINNR